MIASTINIVLNRIAFNLIIIHVAQNRANTNFETHSTKTTPTANFSNLIANLKEEHLAKDCQKKKWDECKKCNIKVIDEEVQEEDPNKEDFGEESK
ncbi:hypothetical protein AMATHDRAFT_7985 [Amanita thiersii Skay4041]|uniref:Uncharacterized protein n=1 Tax=Amanita thiersii Skay4041 TaxID=703135 RepID=A0A2A9NF06_9AGAR|nr:hypothetical protein AMATHDRAFT_7985 [Amanita thiersii Skay4041]